MFSTDPEVLQNCTGFTLCNSAGLAVGECDAVKPGLHIVGKVVSMCLRLCTKEHITAPQVSIAKISCERLLLSKTCVTM